MDPLAEFALDDDASAEDAALAEATCALALGRLDGLVAGLSDDEKALFCMHLLRRALIAALLPARDPMATLGEWRAIASYSHIDPRVRASGPALGLAGLRPAQTPRDQASASIEWNRPDTARIGITARYVAGQFEDDQNSRRLDDAQAGKDAVALGHAALPPGPSARSSRLRATTLSASVSSAPSKIDSTRASTK